MLYLTERTFGIPESDRSQERRTHYDDQTLTQPYIQNFRDQLEN